MVSARRDGQQLRRGGGGIWGIGATFEKAQRKSMSAMAGIVAGGIS